MSESVKQSARFLSFGTTTPRSGLRKAEPRRIGSERRCGGLSSTTAAGATYLVPVLCAGFLLYATGNARAADSRAGRLSISFERVLGYSSNGLEFGDTDAEISVTGLVAGGSNEASPISAPRLAGDLWLANGLTLGLAVGYGKTTEERRDFPNTEFTSSFDKLEIVATNYLFQPRIGYRIATADKYDLVPRLGLGFVGASREGKQKASDDDDFAFDDKLDGTATVVTLEAILHWHATDSFDFVAGVSYDRVLSADGEISRELKWEDDEHERDESDGALDDADGSLSAISVWFGIGGSLRPF